MPIIFPTGMGRNLWVALLASVGLALLGLAAIDWNSYTAFSISLLWK